MKTEIIEPNINRYMRILIKSLFLFVIFFVIFLAGLYFTMSDSINGVIMALLVALLCYLYKNNRVVKVKFIKDTSIILNDGKRDIEVNKEMISYVLKFFRFTFSERFLLAMAIKNGNFLTSKRYLIFNDPKHNLIDLFKNMKIHIKNIP